MSEGVPGTRVATVVIPRELANAASSIEGAYRLLIAIVDYVHDVQKEGAFARHELPGKAVHAYCLHRYLDQQGEGGHSLFISNCSDEFPDMAAGALAALEAMGAQAHAQILTEMIAWAKANPEEASAQNGFDTRAHRLDKLDKRFHAAERKPVALLAARWILSWPELRLVEEEGYKSAIERIAASNPLLRPRLLWRNVQDIRSQMTDPRESIFTAACGAVEPEPEAKTWVGPGSFKEIDGRQCLAFTIYTQRGQRLCVPEDDGGGRLYEFDEVSPLPDLDEEGYLEALANYKPPVLGARLPAVSAETIRRFVAAANETQAPEAVDLLLRKAGLGPEAAITAWKVSDGEALWIAVPGQAATVVARTFRDGAELKSQDGTPLAAVTRAEIERHALEAAATGAAMRAPA